MASSVQSDNFSAYANPWEREEAVSVLHHTQILMTAKFHRFFHPLPLLTTCGFAQQKTVGEVRAAYMAIIVSLVSATASDLWINDVGAFCVCYSSDYEAILDVKKGILRFTIAQERDPSHSVLNWHGYWCGRSLLH